jgi:hypothetical protein
LADGKIENISIPIPISGEKDWEKVRITYDENEVLGLKSYGEVIGKSTKILRFKPKLTSLAEKELKIQAAKKTFIHHLY